MMLSVILPCYNGAQTIAVQLEALANQTYSGEWELIVVNNGSTDNSMEIVESYRDRLPKLRIVDAYIPPGPRLPVAHSYNTGLKAAQGDAFAFCEADDEVTPGWVAAMAKALVHHDLVSGPLQYTKLNESWLIAAAKKQNLPQSQEFEHLPGSDLPFAFGCNFGMKRLVYETIGELDRETFRFAWDVDYCWKAQLAGIKLHFDPEVTLHYRLRHTLKALFRQGYTWGKEGTLIYLHYSGKPLGWANFFFSLRRLIRNLPDGAKQFVFKRLNVRRGRGRFAFWYWMFGYQVGFMAGTLQHIFSHNHIVSQPSFSFEGSGHPHLVKNKMPNSQEV